MTAGNRVRVAVLISGRGSNLASLIAAAQAPGFPAQIVQVLSNRPEAGGLALAARAGIDAKAIDHTRFADRASFDAALDAALRSAGIDLVCCAGFMRIMTPGFVEAWTGRMINIHPSLLPLFRGTRTHERALEAGVRLHGCSVHYVVPELDAGPIIAQAAVPVLPGDDPESLAARVLVEEHVLYPAALAQVASGRVSLDGEKVRFSNDITQPTGRLHTLAG